MFEECEDILRLSSAAVDRVRRLRQVESVADEASEPTKRRRPVQERSRRRLAAIVDGAAELFAERGFDATTIDAIAEAAETSVGSLYQFFPNKTAVFRAVAEDALERSAETFADVMVRPVEARGWRDLVHTVVDTFGHLHEEHPSFRALINNLHLYGEFAEADEAQTRAFVATAEQLLRQWAPQLEPDDRAAVARVVTHSIEAALIVSQRESPALARRMLEQTKAMIVRYLEPIIDDRAKPD